MKKSVVFLAAAMLVPSVAWADVVDSKVELRYANSYNTAANNLLMNVDGTNNVVTGQYFNEYSKYEDAGGNVTSFAPYIKVRTYCLDIVDDADTSLKWYDVDDLKDAPVTATGHPQMGANAAQKIRQLWAGVESEINDPTIEEFQETNYSKDETAAAFALAVWEIAWDDVNAGDLSAGNFTASGNSKAVALANTWFDNLGLTEETATWTVEADNLYALTRDGSQDFVLAEIDTIIEEVPSPTAVAQLIGLGLMMGFIGYRRRRRQS